MLHYVSCAYRENQYPAIEGAVRELLDGLREHGSPVLDEDRYIVIRAYDDEITAEVIDK